MINKKEKLVASPYTVCISKVSIIVADPDPCVLGLPDMDLDPLVRSTDPAPAQVKCTQQIELTCVLVEAVAWAGLLGPGAGEMHPADRTDLCPGGGCGLGWSPEPWRR